MGQNMADAIIIKLRGGLGNQLFQYAFAKYIQKNFPKKKLIIDATYFQKKHIRSLDIHQLMLSDCEWLKKRFLIFDLLYDSYRFIDRLQKHKRDMQFSKNIFGDKYLFCDKTLKLSYLDKGKTSKNIYLAGYFQQEYEIREVRDIMIETVRPREKISEIAESIKGKINEKNSIGISIRIGEDYRRFGWPLCSKEYYLEGLKRILSMHPDSNIIVFADEIDKVKEEKWFEDLPVTYVEQCNSCEGLYLLTLCNDFVIANSTFSWWGAYLGANEKKIVIAPRLFYAGEEMKNSGIALPDAIYLDNFSGKPE